MQVMILEEDPTLRTRITGALAPEGVDILSFGRLGPAKEAVRRANVDILVLGESVEGRLAHDLALLAEWRNPRLGAILLSDREGEEADELFELIPSLQAVLARHTGPRTLARVALATARSQEGIVLLREDDGPAEPEEGQGAAPFAGEAILAVDRSAPALAISFDEEPGPVPPQETDPAEDVSALIREVLAQVAAAPTQEVSPILDAPESLAARRTLSIPDEQPGRLHALPCFLRDAEAEEPEEEDGDTLLTFPSAPILPAQVAAPMRRLHLA